MRIRIEEVLKGLSWQAKEWPMGMTIGCGSVGSKEVKSLATGDWSLATDFVDKRTGIVLLPEFVGISMEEGCLESTSFCW